MPTIVRENIDNLNAVLTVTISREDIAPKIKQELNKFRNKAELKGFRKGKTPINFIKKMYGSAIMTEVVNHTLQEELNAYLDEQKLSLLGQPLPSQDDNSIDLSINNKEDLIFKFDLGLAPDFEVAGASATDTYERYAVEIAEELINNDLESAQKRLGERVTVEDNIQEGDSITINAEELDGDALKENGWATTFTVLYNDMEEGLKKELTSSNTGDKFRFNIKTIEGEKSEEYIKKYLLQVTEGDEDVVIGDHFEAKIIAVERVQAAELNQTFFDKYFGEGKISTEEEARNLIKEDLVKHYDIQADSLLFRDIQEALLEKNNLDFPDEFLKRWLLVSNENNTPEKIEKDYSNFSTSLTWTLVQSQLADQFKVEVSHEEILEHTIATIKSYYGAYMDETMLRSIADNMLKGNETEYNRTAEKVMSNKVFAQLKETVGIKDKAIGSKEFDEVMKEAQEAAAKQQADAMIASEEE